MHKDTIFAILYSSQRLWVNENLMLGNGSDRTDSSIAQKRQMLGVIMVHSQSKVKPALSR